MQSSTQRIVRRFRLARELRRLSVLMFATLLAACAGRQTPEANWPAFMPSVDYYKAHYEADTDNQTVQSWPEYSTWVNRFYTGWVMFSLGWQPMTEQLTEQVEDRPDAVMITTNMAAIGRAISAEWAKDSRHRKINTRHMLVWGHVLQDSVENECVLEMSEIVMRDVGDLLAERLPGSAISEGRYIEVDLAAGGDFDDDFSDDF